LLQWLRRAERPQSGNLASGALARDLWQSRELGALGFKFTSKLFFGGEIILLPGIEPGSVRWFHSVRRASGSMCCLLALYKTCAETPDEGSAWISSLFDRLNGYEIAFERTFGSAIVVIHAPQVHAQRVRRLLEEVLAQDRAMALAAGQVASPDDATPVTPASSVTRSAIDRQVASFIDGYDRTWRRGVRLVMRDEFERWWLFPLGARVFERVGPRGVRWMLVFNDPSIADWASERLESRLATGAFNPTFTLEYHADPGSSKDAGPTVLEGIWTTAPANSREARKQMGRVLMGILYAIRRSRRDEQGRLVVPTTTHADLV